MNTSVYYPALILQPTAADVHDALRSLPKTSPADSLGVILLACDPVAAAALRDLPARASVGVPIITVASAAGISGEQDAPAFRAVWPELELSAAAGEEAKCRTLCEHAPVGIFQVDAEGNCTYLNPRGGEMSGLDLFQTVGKDWMAILHPADRARVLQEWESALQERRAFESVHRLRRPDGGALWVSMKANPFVGENGSHGYVGTLEEITERISAEEELRATQLELQQQRRRLDDLLAQVPGIVWEAHRVPGTTEKRLVYVSRYVETLTGYSVEECLAMPDFWRTIMHPDDRAEASRRAAAVLAGELTGSIVFRWRTKDGREIWIESQAAVIRDETGEPIGLRGINLDVTARTQAEEAVRQQTERLQTIFDHIPVMITCRDGRGRLQYVNREWERTLGWSLNETDFDDLPRLYPDPSERRRAEEQIQAADGRNGDFQSHTRQGRLLHTRWTTVRLSDGSTIGLGHDITESKRASMALERLATEMGLLLESTSEGVYGIDLDGRCTFMNSAGLQMLGYKLPEVLGQNVHDLMHSRRPDGTPYPVEDCPIMKGINRGERCLVETDVFWRKDGSSFPVEYSANPMLELGVLRGAVITFSDITQRLERERRIHEQAQLLDLAHDAITVRDLDDRIQFWSRGAEHIFGWTAEELTDADVKEFLYSDSQAFAAAKAAVLQSGEWHGELGLRARDGREITVNARWTLLRDEQGAPKSVLVIKSDITDQKNLEMRFLRAQRLESIGTLASGVAHDLNNILSPILMSVPLLREPLPAETLQDLISVVETAAQRGAEIVKQVLTFGRGIEGERAPLQVRHLVRELERIACETFPKNIAIENSIAKDTRLIEGDATQLHQVLLNLCVNARDAMPTGGTLRISAQDFYVDEYFAATSPEAKPGSYVQIAVSDTGTGIPPHVLDKIFDPFFTTKAIGTGTGLGLSTVLGIVKSHGGFISVYSEVGRGTAFEVYLPAAASGTVLPVETQEPAAPRGRGERILVVDDEPGLRKLTETILRKHGYEVVLACDGTEALALYAKDPAGIDAVLADVMMPLMDGVTLIRVLRHLDPHVRVISSTGLGEDRRREELRTLGVSAFLTKPYNTASLLKTIHDVLQETGGPALSH